MKGGEKMKKVVGTLLCMTLVLISHIPVYAESEGYTYIFPTELITIEEEAFANTPVETVILPEGFHSLEDSAFENALHLTDIYIPPSTEYIADTAFPENADLTIHGVKGSHAEGWAHKHEIPFVVDDIWNAVVVRHSIRTAPTYNRSKASAILIILLSFISIGYYKLRSQRPQDRPELNPIDYRFP